MVHSLNYFEVEQACVSVASLLGTLRSPVLLVGIPRGGIASAYALKPHIKAEMVFVTTPDEVLSLESAKMGTVVLVDDLVDSGKTMTETADYLQSQGLAVHYRAALFAKGDAPQTRVGTVLHDWIVFPWEQGESGPEDAVRRLIQFAGDDPDRPGLKDTPARYLRFLEEWRKIAEDPPKLTTFASSQQDLVVVKDVAFYSLCEHHLLPYHGVMHVGYLPHGSVLGLSKVPRLVRRYSSKFTIQEDLTADVAHAIQNATASNDVAVVSEATHTCALIRGVRAGADMRMTSSALYGEFREGALRQEFLSLVR